MDGFKLFVCITFSHMYNDVQMYFGGGNEDGQQANTCVLAQKKWVGP